MGQFTSPVTVAPGAVFRARISIFTPTTAAITLSGDYQLGFSIAAPSVKLGYAVA